MSAERGRQILAARVAGRSAEPLTFDAPIKPTVSSPQPQAVMESLPAPALHAMFTPDAAPQPAWSSASDMKAQAQAQADTIVALSGRLQQRLAEESTFNALLTQLDALRLELDDARAAAQIEGRKREGADARIDAAASRAAAAELDAAHAREELALACAEWHDREEALSGAAVDAALERDALKASLEAHEAQLASLEADYAADRRDMRRAPPILCPASN